MTRRCDLMEHFLLDILAMIIAGIFVAWVVKRFNL
jgi:hypothetical protein